VPSLQHASQIAAQEKEFSLLNSQRAGTWASGRNPDSIHYMNGASCLRWRMCQISALSLTFSEEADGMKYVKDRPVLPIAWMLGKRSQWPEQNVKPSTLAGTGWQTAIA
jgi:hypothetical protein